MDAAPPGVDLRRATDTGDAARTGFVSLVLIFAFSLAGWALIIALEVFDNYKDNSDSAYLMMGGMFLVLSAFPMLFLHASGVFKGMQVTHVLVAAAVGVTLTASAYFAFSSIEMSPPDHRSTQPFPPPGNQASGQAGLATPSIATPSIVPVR